MKDVSYHQRTSYLKGFLIEIRKERDMSTLYTFGRCETPLGYISLESYMGPENVHATFYRTDGSDEPLTMAQIGEIIEIGIGTCGQPGEYSFEDCEDPREPYHINDVPYEQIFVTLMLLQTELFQQKYKIADKN